MFIPAARTVTTMEDLIARAGLLNSHLGMATAIPTMTSNLREHFGQGALDEWLKVANSEQALNIIRRFSAHEGDVGNKELLGLGRMSSSSFPRIGGVWAKEARKRSVDRRAVAGLIEEVLHASYLTTLLLIAKARVSPPVIDGERLWNGFVPLALRCDEALFSSLGDAVAFEVYVVGYLQVCGLKDAASAVERHKQPEIRALSGLFGVGAQLALVERCPEIFQTSPFLHV